MANQPEIDQFDAGVYQLEKTDPVLAGLGGVTNAPLVNLANRTRYLYNRIAEILGIAKNYSLAGGTANAITAAYTPAVAAVTDGQTLKFKGGFANTGAATFTPNSGVVAAAPIYGLDHAALTGGEVVVNGNCAVQWNAALNGGNGAWVLIENSGGLRRTATPAPMDSSTQVASTAALMASLGIQSVSLTGAAAAVVLTNVQAGGGIIKFTGVLSQNTVVTVPNTAKVYAIVNATTGAFTLTVQAGTGAGGTVLVGQGNVAEVYADGANGLFRAITEGATAAQFDNSAKLATTACVTAAGFQFGGEYQITTTVSIPLSAIGGLAVFNPSAPVTATLPAVSSVPAGKTITFFNVTNNLCTVAPAGADVIGVNAGTVASVKLGNGDTLTLESNGAGWRAIGGTSTMGNSAAFGASLATSGYQKLPSGLILQWCGPYTVPGSAGTLGITFPLAFPNALFSAQVTVQGAATNMLGWNSGSKTGLTLNSGNTDTTARSVVVWAIGN